LPGEKTRITMKTYSKETQDAKNASSILDSLTEESARDFQNSVQQEQSDKRDQSKNLSYHVDVEAKGSWGFGSVGVKAGVKGETNSAREEFAKNLSSAVEKHAAKASAKRDVQVNTTSEIKSEHTDENAISRQVENINVSRTLNFVFRQMNQEYITLLHLIDVRVAYFDNFAETKREVALYQLDSLIEQRITDGSAAPTFPGTRRAAVRQVILDELRHIFDYRDDPHPDFIEERVLLIDPASGEKPENVAQRYVQIRRPYVSTFNTTAGTAINVPGIIVDADSHVLRTDGVMVEALLGVGEALDSYSQGLQREAERAKELANTQLNATVAREELAQLLVRSKATDGATLFAEMFYPPAQPALSNGVEPR
jgi:hypothetical protein